MFPLLAAARGRSKAQGNHNDSIQIREKFKVLC
jgi:hypothetical protein